MHSIWEWYINFQAYLRLINYINKNHIEAEYTIESHLFNKIVDQSFLLTWFTTNLRFVCNKILYI